MSTELNARKRRGDAWVAAMVKAAVEKKKVPACTLALLDISAKYNIRRRPKSSSLSTLTQLNVPDGDDCIMEKPLISKRGKITLHLVRHGEAEHNIPTFPPQLAYDILDPGLTAHGIAQCRQLQKTFPYMDKITHVMSSPLRRTLETTRYSFGPIFQRGLKVVAYPILREKESTNSSTGTPLDLLRRYHGSPPLDLSLLAEGWEINEEDTDGVYARVQKMKEDIFTFGTNILEGAPSNWADFGEGPRINDDGNVEIVAVTHAGFLAAVDGVEEETYRHVEFRSFEFEIEIGPAGRVINLVETKESRARVHTTLFKDTQARTRGKSPAMLRFAPVRYVDRFQSFTTD